MSYQVIARKYRPGAFQDLVGQDAIAQTLLNAIRNQRVPHAILFCGPRGTGKTSSARIFAKILRCKNRNEKTLEPCQVCDSCVEITQGSSSDVREIDGASHNGVDAIRELKEGVNYMPSSGSYKIYIIDEVHMLSQSAFNALLKTLEEPPAHVVFCFATTEPQKLPDTILSRCQRFDLKKISGKKVVEHIKGILAAEGIPYEEPALWQIAKAGEGSMRDSLTRLDQVISFSNQNVNLEMTNQVLGLNHTEIVSSMLEDLLLKSETGVLRNIQRLRDLGTEPHLFLKDLLQKLRDLLIVKLSKSAESDLESLELSPMETQSLISLSQKSQETLIHFLFDMGLKSYQDVIKAPDPQVALDFCLLKMVRASDLLRLGDWIQSTAPSRPPSTVNLKSEPSPSPIQNELRSASTDQIAPHTAVDIQVENWTEIVGRIKNLNPKVGATLENLKWGGFDSKKSELALLVPDQFKFLVSQVMAEDFQNQLKEALKKVSGSTISVRIDLLSSAGKPASKLASAKEIEDQRKQEQDQELLEKVKAHPLVKELQTHLEATVTRVTPLNTTE